MLRKLVKYSNKSISRIMIPVYCILVFVTVLSLYIYSINFQNTLGEIVKGFTAFIQIVTILGAAFGCMIILLYRFYQTIVCDQAYFTFTLPVSVKSHIASNCIVGILWMFVTTILCTLSCTLMISFLYRSAYQEIITSLKQLYEYVSDQVYFPLFIILNILLIFLAFLGQSLIMQLCFAAGQTFTSHKILGSFVTYLIISAVGQILSCFTVVPYFLRYGFKKQTMTFDGFLLLLQGSLISALILTIGSYFLTKYFLSKRLNLD